MRRRSSSPPWRRRISHGRPLPVRNAHARPKMKRIRGRPHDPPRRRRGGGGGGDGRRASASTSRPAAAKVRFAGPSAEEEREARRHHRAAHKHRQRRHREKKPWERVHIMEEGTGDEARGASAGRSDATKTREDYAQEGERPVSFAASVGRFDGKPKNMKAYPHHLAPGVLRRQMGMASRTADAERRAREGARGEVRRRHARDGRRRGGVRRGAPPVGREAPPPRAARLAAHVADVRLPRAPRQDVRLALDARVLRAHQQHPLRLPDERVVGARQDRAAHPRRPPVRALAPSSKHHPFVFELSVNPYFMERDVLSLFELSAPRRDEHTRWIRSIRYTSARVSPLFRRTGDRSQHVHEVEA